jgi:hypothetical protein
MRTRSTKWRWLALVALLSGTQAAAQRLPFTWDVPKMLDVVEVPGVMMADGYPVQIRAVRSAEKPQVLLQHMVDRFEAWGFYIPPNQKQIFREPQITALDVEKLISYTVIFQPNPDGTTTLLLGEANFSRPPGKHSPVAPLFAGAASVMHTDMEGTRTVTYVVSAKAAEVEEFYRKELPKGGFNETEPNLYRNGSEELQVLVRSTKADQTTVVIMRRGAPQVAPTQGDD